jgi:hypothetical protein
MQVDKAEVYKDILKHKFEHNVDHTHSVSD